MRPSTSLLLPILFMFFLASACSMVPAYKPSAANPKVSDALILEDFEDAFSQVTSRLNELSSREEIASSLLEAQARLGESYGDENLPYEGEETGRCVLVAEIDMPELKSESGIKRGGSSAVLFSDYLRKSSGCLEFFRERFGDSWAKNAGSLAVSFFSYSI